MKTILEWYEELPDGIRERAIAARDPSYSFYEEMPNSLDDAILNGFSWIDAPEEAVEDPRFICKHFWYEVHREAENTGKVEYQERAKLSKHKAVKTPMFLGLEI